MGPFSWRKPSREEQPGPPRSLLDGFSELVVNLLTVQPDSDLVISIWVLRGEEPEVELGGLVGSLADGEETSVRLANVEVDIGNGACSAINGECC